MRRNVRKFKIAVILLLATTPFLVQYGLGRADMFWVAAAAALACMVNVFFS